MEGYFSKTTSAAPLAVFRIALGLLMLYSTLRFWLEGWIHTLYIAPKVFFTYYGFEFVQALGPYTYILFVLCAVSAVLVALGWYYRLAILVLFLSFTYIELIDKTTYLNHYYFMSMVCLMMIFLPAHVYFSVDAYRNRRLLASDIPLWCVDVVKLFVSMLYFYAGLAKINSDWLLQALPLRIWLPAKNDLPLIGFLFNHEWVYYAFSWFGCIYDLSIPFLLWRRRTRPWAYVAVVVFHTLTAILFPIGVFPYVMIVTALIFFSKSFHLAILSRLAKIFKLSQDFISPLYSYQPQTLTLRALTVFFGIFFTVQFLMPLRFIFYPGKLFWTEQGFRFSWRVMLMEKAGYAQFSVKDAQGKRILIDNSTFLTPLQEKMMATQPDMILQYAHMISHYFVNKGLINPEVYVDSYVVLNGHRGRPLVDPHVNLAVQSESFKHKPWILPYND